MKYINSDNDFELTLADRTTVQLYLATLSLQISTVFTCDWLRVVVCMKPQLS